MDCLPKSIATRGYLKRFSASMGMYVMTLLGATWIFKHHPPSGALALGLALLPGLAIVGVIISVGLYIAEEKDEFQRSILMQSMIWAIGATLSLSTVWGILEMFLKVPTLQVFILFPIFCAVMGLVSYLLKRGYR